MKQIFNRLYLSLFYLSFIATMFGAYQIYERFKIIYKSRQSIELNIDKLNNQISTFVNPDIIEQDFLKQIQASRDCYQALVQKWEYSKDCEENQSMYYYDNLQYIFDSSFIFLFLIMLIPLWIALTKKWIIWIAKGKT